MISFCVLQLKYSGLSSDIFQLDIFKMPKKGQPDSYWMEIMKSYAQGSYKFTKGKRPGSKKWRDVLKRIEACPRHQEGGGLDLRGHRLVCKCGYHEVGKICFYSLN